MIPILDEFISKNKKILLVIFGIAILIFVVLIFFRGIVDAFGAVFAWIATTFGLAKARANKRKIERESSRDLSNLDKKTDKIVDDVAKTDREIDAQVKRDAAPAPTPERDKADVLRLLDDLDKGDE